MKVRARWFSLAFLTAVVMVVLVACGGQGQTTNPPPPPPAGTATFDTSTFDGTATFGP